MPGPDPSAFVPLVALGGSLYSLLTNPDLGSFASIVGAGVSIWVLVSLSDLRKRVLLKRLGPSAIKKLRTHATAISNAMEDFDGSLSAIDQEIAVANVTLRDIYGKVNREYRGQLKPGLTEMRRYLRSKRIEKTREQARDIYTQLLVSSRVIETAMANYQEEP